MNNRIKFFLAICCICISGCKSEMNKAKVISDHQNFPVVIDTLKAEAVLNSSGVFTMGDYRPLYIGEKTDTILANHWLNCLNVGREYNINDTVKSRYYVEWDQPLQHLQSWMKSGISIQVDTTQRVKGQALYSEGYVHAYPVLLENMEEDTIQIGYGRHLPIITEAKDKLNKWRPIDEMWMYDCGVGLGTMILPPEEIVLTAVSIYDGNFKTKMRVKVGNNYSNVFEGSINLKQFKEEKTRSRVVLGPF